MDLGLKGRKVLITGGSQGIGLACARGFLAEGCDVAIAARDQKKIDDAIASLRDAGPGKITGKSIDLSQRGAADRLADAFPDTDILVNNAGAIPIGDIFEVDEERWRAAWDLKVFGYINLTRAMYRHMKGKAPKAIVNVVGTGGEKAQWRYACGTPANIALYGLTKAMGGRSIDDGIRIVAVSPGAVETERWRNLHKKRARDKFGTDENWREILSDDQPLKRAASPEEVANVVVFMASDRASWVSAEVVTVDGGRLHRENWF